VARMAHKRSGEKRQRRLVRKIILSSGFRDGIRAETVSRLSRLEVLELLTRSIDVDAVPDVEHGEVLVEPRGEGSFQKEEMKNG
jgi:hypothetical protein